MKKLCVSFMVLICTMMHLSAQSNSNQIYGFSVKTDLPLAIVGLGTYSAGLKFQSTTQALDSAQINALDINLVNPFDQISTRLWSEKADKASYGLLYASYAAPLLLYTTQNGRNNALPIAVMFAESYFVSVGINIFTKGSVRRNRPLLYNSEAPWDTKLTSDARLSFFSGHASSTSTFCFLTAKIYNDLYPDSKWRGLVWGTAVAIPAATSILRVVAGRHYPTDVIFGFGLGALIGWGIPTLHKKNSHNMSFYPLGGNQVGLGMVKAF